MKSKFYNYSIGKNKYSIEIKKLKEYYLEYIELSDSEFMERLPEITHLACILSYLDRLGTMHVLSDEGLVHQLIHLMHIPDEPLINIIAIRSPFEAELYWVTQEEI